MRFLVDNSLSWRVARDLRAAGHDAIHIADLGLASADDRLVYERAVTEGRVILTQDSDFGPIHAASEKRVGVVMVRLTSGRPAVQARTLIANLADVEAHLLAGAFVTLADDAITIQE